MPECDWCGALVHNEKLAPCIDCGELCCPRCINNHDCPDETGDAADELDEEDDEDA